jgi:hypothetical protein
VNADWARRAGKRAVEFYRLVAPIADRLPMLADCYHTGYDEATGDSSPLLLDHSATHATPITRRQVLALEGLPTPAQLDGIVDALARFQTF